MRARIQKIIATARERREQRKAERLAERAARRKAAQDLERRGRIYGLSVATATATAAPLARRRRGLFGRMLGRA